MRDNCVRDRSDAAKGRMGRLCLTVIVFCLAALPALVIGTTHETKTQSGMRFYENTKFKFMISAVPDSCVDPECQRFWANTWPTGVKCIAGINVPFARRQFTFHVLRWSWKRQSLL